MSPRTRWGASDPTPEVDAAGWCDDPYSGPGWERWWDGERWTGRARPAATEAVPTSPSALAGAVGHLAPLYVPTPHSPPSRPGITRPGISGLGAVYNPQPRRHRARRAAIERRARATRAAGPAAMAARTARAAVLSADEPEVSTVPAGEPADPGAGTEAGTGTGTGTGTGAEAGTDGGGSVNAKAMVVTVRSVQAAPPAVGPPPPEAPPERVAEPASGGRGRRPWVVAGSVAAAVVVVAIVVAAESSGGGGGTRSASAPTSPPATAPITAPAATAPAATVPAATGPAATVPAATVPAATAPAVTAPPATAPSAAKVASPAGACPSGGLSVTLTSSARPLGPSTWEVSLSGVVRSTATSGLRIGSVLADLRVGGSTISTVQATPTLFLLQPGQSTTLTGFTEVHGPAAPEVAFGGASAAWTAAGTTSCPLPH